MLPETRVKHLADLRREQLARASVAKSENLLSEYVQAGLKLRVTSQSGRDNVSPEAALIQEARNRRRRAEKCGFHSIEDRVEHDLQFMERTLQMGHDFRAAQKQDWLCHCLARLAYVDVVPEHFPEPMDYITEQWCISRKVAVTLPDFSFCFSKNVLYPELEPISLRNPPFNSTLARLGVNGSKTL